MALDNRQTEIREGAGLEESRLNVEFIDFLKKYSTPILLVIAIVCVTYFGVTRYRLMVDQGLDEAFAQLDAARASRNPVSLIRVAEEFGEKASVGVLARLEAADLNLEAYRTGVPAGVVVGRDDKLPEGTSLLTPEERTKALGTAKDLYQQAFDRTKSEIGNATQAIGALFGLAAVAECDGKIDEARAFYTQIQERGTAAKLDLSVRIAKARAGSLDALAQAPKLYASETLAPNSPSRVVPFTSPVTNLKAMTVDGKVVPMDGSGGGITIPEEHKPIEVQLPPAQQPTTEPGPIPTTGDPTRVPVRPITPVPAPVPAAVPAPVPAPVPATPKK